MKPIIILPPDAMSDENINLLRENGLCVVVAKDPALVKFVDSIPATSSRTQIEQAAIELSRRILNGQTGCIGFPLHRNEIARLWSEILCQGTPLDPTYEPIEKTNQRIFDTAKAEELRRLAREEAKAERAAKQKAKA